MLGIIDLVGGSIVLILTSIIFAYILLEPKNFKVTLKKIIMAFLGVCIYSIVANYTNEALKTLSLCCVYVTLFRTWFKVSYYEAILLTFMYIVLIIIPDILSLLFSIFILKIPTEVFFAEYTERVLGTIIVNILFILMVCIFKKFLRKLFEIKPFINNKIVIYAILTLGCIVIVFYNALTDIKIISENLLISLMIMAVFVVILYNLIKQKMENDKVVEKYDKLLEFIKKYEVAIEEQRMMRHETKNQLITVKSKVLNKENEQEIIKYVDSLLNDHKSYKEDKYGKFQYLPANGLKGLFYYKAMEAEEKEIALSINIGKRVENSILSKLSTEDFKQLGRIIGVYLDNAIEASCESEEKKMGIEIYTHKEDIIIMIENTYYGVVDTESVGKVKYSTKGNGHGYGLMLVNKIINSSELFKTERVVTDKLYIQKLIIKNN